MTPEELAHLAVVEKGLDSCAEIVEAVRARLGVFWTPSPSSERAKTWISVEERLPARGVAVLVARPDLEAPAFAWRDWRDWRKEGLVWKTSERTVGLLPWTPTHWMPLPEPPKQLDNPKP
jgi:hypothetical protein